MVAVDHVSFTRVGSDYDEGNFHVHIGSIRLDCLLMMLKNLINRRRLTEQVEVGV